MVEISENDRKIKINTFISIFGAINQSLFWELSKIPRFDGIKSFQGADGGEGPARSALSLIFDLRNGPLLSPVNRISCGTVQKRLFSLGFSFSASVKSDKLLICQIHELVGSHCERSPRLVVLSNCLVVLLVNFESVLVLIRTILFSVLRFPDFKRRKQRVFADVHLSLVLHQEPDSCQS